MRRVAIITGGSRGIGRTTALLAAAQGYDVCISFLSNANAAKEVCSQCESHNVSATAFQADVADETQVNRLFDHCDATLGAPYLLVNNAGVIGGASSFEKLPTNALKETFGANVFGTAYCTQNAIPRMSATNGGQGGVIVNISSTAAVTGSPNEYVHYAASKAAVETMTIGLSKELGPQKIRVNAIRAGTTATELHEKSGNPDRPKQMAKIVPLGRIAEPEDIAEAVIWLASDKASYVTGSILSVAGGI